MPTEVQIKGLEATFLALSRAHEMIFDAAFDGVDEAMNQFRVEFTTNRLQRRANDSLGPRTRNMLEAFGTEVSGTRAGGQQRVVGRAFFDGDSLLQMIVRVHVFGTTGKGGKLPPIRPKNAKYLKFKLERKYARGPWEFPEKEQWLSVKEVNIPPRLPIFADWQEYEPTAHTIVDAHINQVLMKLK